LLNFPACLQPGQAGTKKGRYTAQRKEIKMQNMIYALRERIGEPSLFCGRKREMELLLNWAEKIPGEISKSRPLLDRRKSGETAIMQRLFNILWNKNGTVIPFYFEILNFDQWLLDFSADYYRTFLSQYLSFKTIGIYRFHHKRGQ
jgi:hypothetical protein